MFYCYKCGTELHTFIVMGRKNKRHTYCEKCARRIGWKPPILKDVTKIIHRTRKAVRNGTEGQRIGGDK